MSQKRWAEIRENQGKRVIKVFTKEAVQRLQGEKEAKGKFSWDQEEHRAARVSRSPLNSRRARPSYDRRLRGLLRDHQKKRQRALVRRKRYEVRLRATRGERSLLEMASIQEPQRKDYARRLEAFYAFAVRYELDVSQEKRLDEALCEFVDHLFLDGEDVNYGQKLQAALEYERPEFSRHGRLALPRFRRALKGWRRLAPTQTRLPMLEFLKSAVSGIFLEEGHREEALYNEVTFSCYTRPGETVRIQAADVVPATHKFDKTVMVLGPLERGVSSKVGVYDETVILDDRRAPWLGFSRRSGN